MTYGNVSDFAKAREIESKTELSIYNPLFDPFEVKYDGDVIVLQPQAITTLPKDKADHVIVQLRDHLVNIRGKGPVHLDRQKALEEILV